MLAKGSSCKDLGILLFNLKKMCFYIVFFCFYDTNIDDTSWQSSTFDQNLFPIRELSNSDTSISDFINRKSLQNLLHPSPKK